MMYLWLAQATASIAAMVRRTMTMMLTIDMAAP
jgi:hypothetical protein